MTRLFLAFAMTLPLALAACSAAPPTRTGGPLPPARMVCNADSAQSAVGKPATPDLIERVRGDSHSRVVRVIHPGEMITMDYSFERVDIRVDGNNVILAVNCG
ncbi:MAG: hypothetical protein JWL98_1024 [Xanthomonadaceae bacterium]|nr:hypothetical protein [Xanthomonadaceae bacterium]